ncbi:MAG: ATP-binding cassette domain-containing protein [Lachnospiraceae bacterium]|nr:ATP-binding cassette domain-containing protein [Lachnospiraceae bacterium]
MEYVIRTENLTKKYGKFLALSNVNMSIPKGAIYGFVGKNGAGKTTLIRLLCGLQDPTEGWYSIYGIQNNDKRIIQSRKRMGAIVETPSIYMNMTARDNLIEQYRILGIKELDGIDELLELVNLAGTSSKKARHFSLGMRQRLGIAIALVGNPDFLVLDEPINGLDPEGIIEIRELLLKLNREMKITILISSHILEELSKLATHYGFIDKGRVIKELSAQEIEDLCRKCIRVDMDDTGKLCKALDDYGVEYKIISNHIADIYGDIAITDIVLKLAEVGGKVENIYNKDENLETFYIKLLRGDINE